jgi:hypothetical protein
MSRFWAGDDSGSSSESDSGSGSESEQEKKVQTNRWAAVSDSDSSDEGERVVRSAKDKAWDGMKAVVSKISNARKINDWHEMQTQFDLLNKQVDKVPTAASRGLSEIRRHRRDSRFGRDRDSICITHRPRRTSRRRACLDFTFVP